MNSENVITDQEEVERALKSIAKIAETVNRMEWNYDRLVSKRAKLLSQAIVAFWKSISLKDDFLYDIRLNYSTYEYDCGMLNENLTRELLKLDGINSNGNEEIRLKRKEQVKRILELQDNITILHQRAVSLSVYYRSLLAAPRYQALLASENEENEENSPNLLEVDEPEDDVPTEIEIEGEEEEKEDKKSPVPSSIKKQSSLKRQRSVHRIPVLSPTEFEEQIQQQQQQHKEEMNGVVNTKDSVMSAMEEEKEENILSDEDAELLLEEILNENNNNDNDNEEGENKGNDDRDNTDLLNEFDVEPSSDPMNTHESNEQQRESEMMEEEDEKENENENENENDENDDENENDDDDQYIRSDFTPRYQWLRRGNELCLVLLDVEVDQKSVQIVTRPPTRKLHHSRLSSSLSPYTEGRVIIRGYRIQKTTQSGGYYSFFYNPQPMFAYIPFTTVIRIPDLPVDYSQSPRAMYYNDQNVLEVTYAIKQIKQQQQQQQPFPSTTARRPFSTSSPRQFLRDPRFDEYDSDGESGYYQSPYYRNPYSSYRQQYRPQRNAFYPFFGNGLW